MQDNLQLWGMKEGYIYMVLKGSSYHGCSFGDIVVGTGKEFCPQFPPIMHYYEFDDENRTQILQDDEVVEICEL